MITLGKRSRGGSAGGPGVSPVIAATDTFFLSNFTTNMPLHVRPWLERYEKDFRTGSLIFCFSGGETRQNITTAGDIPVVNHMLKSKHRMDKDQSKNYLFAESDDSADGLMQKWKSFGVMLLDMKPESQMQRLLNCTVFGRCKAANMWGPVRMGDVLGLAVVKVPKDKFATIHQPDGSSRPAGVLEDDVWQLMPCKNGRLVRAVADWLGDVAIEHHIHVGIVSKCVTRPPRASAIIAATQITERLTSLPHIEILID